MLRIGAGRVRRPGVAWSPRGFSRARTGRKHVVPPRRAVRADPSSHTGRGLRSATANHAATAPGDDRVRLIGDSHGVSPRPAAPDLVAAAVFMIGCSRSGRHADTFPDPAHPIMAGLPAHTIETPPTCRQSQAPRTGSKHSGCHRRRSGRPRRGQPRPHSINADTPNVDLSETEIHHPGLDALPTELWATSRPRWRSGWRGTSTTGCPARPDPDLDRARSQPKTHRRARVPGTALSR